MAKKTKSREPKRKRARAKSEAAGGIDTIDRLVAAVERVADVLEDIADCAIYENDGVAYIGISVNQNSDVIGDDTEEDDEDDEEEDEPESEK